MHASIHIVYYNTWASLHYHLRTTSTNTPNTTPPQDYLNKHITTSGLPQKHNKHNTTNAPPHVSSPRHHHHHHYYNTPT